MNICEYLAKLQARMLLLLWNYAQKQTQRPTQAASVEIVEFSSGLVFGIGGFVVCQTGFCSLLPDNRDARFVVDTSRMALRQSSSACWLFSTGHFSVLCDGPAAWIQDMYSGGHTGGASGAVHQGPRPLGAHQRRPDNNFFKINFFCFSRCQSQWLLQRDRFLNWS